MDKLVFDKKTFGGNKAFDSINIVANSEPEVFGEKLRRFEYKYKNIICVQYEVDIKMECPEDKLLYIFEHPSISIKNLCFDSERMITKFPTKAHLRFKYIPSANNLFIDKEKIYIAFHKNQVYKKGDIIAKGIFLEKNKFFVEK